MSYTDVSVSTSVLGRLGSVGSPEGWLSGTGNLAGYESDKIHYGSSQRYIGGRHKYGLVGPVSPKGLNDNPSDEAVVPLTMKPCPTPTVPSDCLHDSSFRTSSF